jgi:hypothetical protein
MPLVIHPDELRWPLVERLQLASATSSSTTSTRVT